MNSRWPKSCLRAFEKRNESLMSTASTSLPNITFPDDYGGQSEFETPSRGYLSGVTVELPDGSRYALYFTDPTRLRQDLAYDTDDSVYYFAEPGLVVLREVNTTSIRNAVLDLFRDGFFQQLKPLRG